MRAFFMGGFVPDCHTQTFVEVAKLEIFMALFPKQDGRRQTLWGGTRSEIHGPDHWYANICPDIDDLTVIEDAKTIVDACYPQTTARSLVATTTRSQRASIC
jgi:hypothetical protein